MLSSPPPQNPFISHPLPIIVFSASLSLLTGAFTGIFSPIAGIMIPPYLGPFVLLAIMARGTKEHTEGQKAWMMAVSIAIVCIPLGVVGTLMAQ